MAGLRIEWQAPEVSEASDRPLRRTSCSPWSASSSRGARFGGADTVREPTRRDPHPSGSQVHEAWPSGFLDPTGWDQSLRRAVTIRSVALGSAEPYPPSPPSRTASRALPKVVLSIPAFMAWLGMSAFLGGLVAAGCVLLG